MGKLILWGGVAAIVVSHAHGLLACDLRQAPKPAAQLVRKSIRLVPIDHRWRVERRDAADAPLLSRRIILQ